MCCTRLDWGYGYEIVRETSLRGAWLIDLWTTLTGGADKPVPRVATPFDIQPDAQLIAYFEQHPTPVVAYLTDLPSPTVPYLAAEGVNLLVPLVTQGRLVGLLSLGEPVGGGAYSQDDLAFLTTLADEAAAAARIAQLLARARTDAPDRRHRPGGNVNGRGGVSSPTSS